MVKQEQRIEEHQNEKASLLHYNFLKYQLYETILFVNCLVLNNDGNLRADNYLNYSCGVQQILIIQRQTIKRNK